MSHSGKTLAANLYNPHEQSKDVLIGRFVARQPLFQDIYQLVRHDDLASSVQHILIEGQRGMGKTTLLLRLGYEIENDAALTARLIPIVLKEEAHYGIRRLFHLWETVAAELERKQREFAGLSAQMLAAYSDGTNYEPLCFDILTQALEAHSRKIILFVDNFGELLRNLTLWEQLRLCQILGTSPMLRIVAASAVALETFAREAEPLLPLFQRVRLEGLNKEETHALLLELGKASGEESVIRNILNRQPGRVESLRLLTGGVIRTIVLLFDIFTDQEDSSTLADLDQTLDRVTPLYKSRMDDLTPLQREVVNTIALGWEAMSAEEIAQKARLSLEEVAQALEDLTRVFLIDAAQSEASAPLYRLKERFFNIWYLMRLTSGASQERVVWLVHFLENWYNAAELTQHAQRHILAVAEGEYQAKAALYLTEAFARSGQLDAETEHKMIAVTRRLLEATDLPLAAELSRSDKELLAEGDNLYQQEQFGAAIEKYQAMKRKHASINFKIGYAFSRIGRHQDAETYFLRAMRGNHVDALIQLGHLYSRQLFDAKKAEKYYQKAVEKGRPDALLHLGKFYHWIRKDAASAEQCYLDTIKEGQVRAKVLRSGSFSLKGLKSYLVTAIRGETEDAERYNIEDFPGAKQDYLELIEQAAAEAMFQLGNLYADVKEHHAEAEAHYAMAAEAGHVGAMVTLGEFAQSALQDVNKAEKYYQMAAEKGDVHAMVNLGLLHHETLKNSAKAEQYYAMAAEQGDVLAMNGLAWLYFQEHRQKAAALEYAKRVVGANRNMYTAHTAACIYLWNDDGSGASDLAEMFLAPDALKTMEPDALLYLLLLLAKGRYQTAYDYFQQRGAALRDRFAPVYYALLSLAGEGEFRKCPPELEAPVNDILQRVERMAREYA